MNIIIDIEKQPTWTDKIISLEIGGFFLARYSKRQTISPLISRLKNDIKYYYMVFETVKVVIKGIEYLKVTRMEDETND